MSKMKEVAETLGVEIGKEFKVSYADSYYRITDSRFESLTVLGGWIEAPADILYDLLTGKREIIRKPFKPKKGEDYWCVTYCGASPVVWHGSVPDLMYYAEGNCFETKKEAEANYKKVIERLEKVFYDSIPMPQAKQIGGK